MLDEAKARLLRLARREAWAGAWHVRGGKTVRKTAPFCLAGASGVLERIGQAFDKKKSNVRGSSF